MNNFTISADALKEHNMCYKLYAFYICRRPITIKLQFDNVDEIIFFIL